MSKSKSRQAKHDYGHHTHLSASEKKKEQRIKKDKELDNALENTFPASDATAKY